MITANLEPLNEEIFTLTQPLSQLIQENLAHNYLTMCPRIHQTQSRHSPINEMGTSRALPGSAIQIEVRDFRPTLTFMSQTIFFTKLHQFKYQTQLRCLTLCALEGDVFGTPAYIKIEKS